MSPILTRARSLMMVFAALALPIPATASTALNCFGTASGKTVIQVHAILDCALDDGSFAWCDIDVKINDQWLNLSRTLRSVTSPGIVASDDAVVFMGRATVSWKGRHIKDLAVSCDDPG